MGFGSGAEYYGETLPQACWRFYLKRRYSDVAACTDEISTQEQAPDFARKAVRESAALGLIDENTALNGSVKRKDAALMIRRLAL